MVAATVAAVVVVVNGMEEMKEGKKEKKEAVIDFGNDGGISECVRSIKANRLEVARATTKHISEKHCIKTQISRTVSLRCVSLFFLNGKFVIKWSLREH